MSTSVSRVSGQITPIRSRILAGISAAIIGLIIVFGVGFVQGEQNVVHNAAHDSRHSFAFPCH